MVVAKKITYFWPKEGDVIWSNGRGLFGPHCLFGKIPGTPESFVSGIHHKNTNLHWIQVSWSQLHYSKPKFCLTSFLSGFLLAKKTFESPLNQSDGRSGWRISPPKWPLVVFSNMLGTVFVTPNYHSALLKHILHRYIYIHIYTYIHIYIYILYLYTKVIYFWSQKSYHSSAQKLIETDWSSFSPPRFGAFTCLTISGDVAKAGLGCLGSGGSGGSQEGHDQGVPPKGLQQDLEVGFRSWKSLEPGKIHLETLKIDDFGARMFLFQGDIFEVSS